MVVRALDRAAMPGAFLQQPRAAMDAHIAERTKHAVVGTDGDDLCAGNLGRRRSRPVAATCEAGPSNCHVRQKIRSRSRLVGRRVEVEPRVKVANHS